jgi:hypothetical protein
VKFPRQRSSQFDPAAFSGRLKAIDPLMAQNYDAQQVSIQQKQQDEALARQQKLVQLQNGLADLDTKDRAAADAKRKQIKEVTGKAATTRVGHQKRSARAKGRGLSVRPQRRHARPQLAQQVQGMPEQYTPEIEPQLDTIIASGLEVDKLIDNSRQSNPGRDGAAQQGDGNEARTSGHSVPGRTEAERCP